MRVCGVCVPISKWTTQVAGATKNLLADENGTNMRPLAPFLHPSATQCAFQQIVSPIERQHIAVYMIFHTAEGVYVRWKWSFSGTAY